MSTTYWAVKRELNGLAIWLAPSGPHYMWDESKACRFKFMSLGHAKRAMGDIGWGQYVKVTRHTAAESRQRAEARGEVRALEAVLGSVLALGPIGVEPLRRLLTDARKRAGIREGGR